MPCYLKLRRWSRKKMNFWKWFRTAVGCPFILLLLKVVWILFLYGILRSANQLIKETYQPWTVNWICNYQLWFIIRKRRLSKHLTAPQILFWKYDVMWCYLMWLFCEYVLVLWIGSEWLWLASLYAPAQVPPPADGNVPGPDSGKSNGLADGDAPDIFSAETLPVSSLFII